MDPSSMFAGAVFGAWLALQAVVIGQAVRRDRAALNQPVHYDALWRGLMFTTTSRNEAVGYTKVYFAPEATK